METIEVVGVSKSKDIAVDSKKEFDELKKLKQKYAIVFTEPNDLPPSRGTCDHKIPLIPGEGPVNIRPYRYPLKQ